VTGGFHPAAGDAARGRAVFERACAPCHVTGGLGHHVGPELTGLGHRSVEDLLTNILDPNMALNPAYAAYTAELADGELESGILAAETPQGVTLLQALGRRTATSTTTSGSAPPWTCPALTSRRSRTTSAWTTASSCT
jgi:putative heme-binding domain-containing protein